MMKCSVCLGPVSMKPDKVDRRAPNDDGGWDHASCRGLIPLTREEKLLREIFGEPPTDYGPSGNRAQHATREMAEVNGHVVTKERGVIGAGDRVRVGRRMVCTCGWRSTVLFGAEQAKAAAEHLKQTAIYG